MNLVRKGEPSLAVQGAIAQLNALDATFDASHQNLFSARAKACSIGDEAELRAAGGGQSLAIPSSGLEAEA